MRIEVETASTIGRYRIHAVSEMTGVASATLRAWERRYGIPEPSRSGSSYRLYTERDVALVRRLRALCDGGMAIGEAADLVRRDGGVVEASDEFAEASERIVDAARRFDHTGLERAVSQAVLLGSALQVTDRVFTPALRVVGELWASGSLSVAQEHLATSVVGATLRTMARHAGPGDGVRRVVLACFEDESHDLGLSGVALALGSWGIDPIVLGTRVAPAELARTVEAIAPNAVGLSLSMPPSDVRVAALVEGYARACGATPWMVGGAGAPSVAAAVRARGGEVLDGVVGHWRESIEAMVARGRRASATRPG